MRARACVRALGGQAVWGLELRGMGYVTIELMIHIAVRISDASTHCPAGAELPAMQCDPMPTGWQAAPPHEPLTLPACTDTTATRGDAAQKKHTATHCNTVTTSTHCNTVTT